MVPFLRSQRAEALAWARQQHESSMRSGGAAVTMHLVRDPIGSMWVIADHEQTRFAQLSRASIDIIQSVPSATESNP